MGLFQTPFWKYQDERDMPKCRYGKGEMMNDEVYEKCTLCPSTMTTSR